MRFALRTLLRSPWYTATAVGTIALTIALGSTVFAVVDGVLFKPLPYPEADRLFAVRGTAGGRMGSASLAALDVQYLREADPRISVTATGGGYNFRLPDRPDVRLWSLAVDAQFFDVLGQRPLVGGFRAQDFVEAEAGTAATPAIVTYGFWRQWLGSDPAAIGRTLHLVNGSLRVVGVLPRDFVIPVTASSLGQTAVLVPLVVPKAAANDRWRRAYSAVVRLSGDLDTRLGKSLLDRALEAHAGEYPPQNMRPGPYTAVFMESLGASLGERERPFLGAAFAGAALLVLLGAINVAGLVGARARDRHVELSVRAALGAKRRELLGVVLREAFVTATLGAVVGLVLTGPFLSAAMSALPESMTLLKAPTIDWRVVIFATLAAIVPVIVCALVPAMSTTRDAIGRRLAETGRTTPRTRWSLRLLLATESAIGIVLVVAGASVLTGFVILRAEDSGFDEGGLAVVELMFTQQVSPAARFAAEERVFDRMRRIPGVRGVATMSGPLLEQLYAGGIFAYPPGARSRIMANEIPVSATFFDVTGVRAIDGRVLTAEEIDAARPVVVVSENVARAYWPNARAIGQTLESSFRIAPGTGATEPGKTIVTVVGVVNDARLGSQKDVNFGQIYMPVGLGRRNWTVFLLKTDTPAEAARSAALAIRSDVPGVMARRAEAFDAALAKSVRQERFQAVLFGMAGGASLLLLAVGVGGLAAMSVAGRVREIGIRSALGARQRQLVRMITLEHLRPSLVGVLFGLVGAWWTTRLVRAFVYRIDVHEPAVWLAATATLILVATAGAWLPARRASRVDPMVVLRAE